MCKQWHPRYWTVILDAEASGRFTKCSAGSLDDAGAGLDSPQPGDNSALAAQRSCGPGEASHPVRAGTAVELARQLGVRYNIMWSSKHKVRQVMKERDDTCPLDGWV